MKQFFKLKLLLLLAMLCSGYFTDAQIQRVVGTVTGEGQKPLEGAAVQIVGKPATGTLTDDFGKYAINAEKGDVLNFSFTGYESQRVTVGENPTINISLVLSDNAMDEIVVVGYGTQRRKEFAGASTTVNPLATKFTPSANVGTALQGSVPGVMVRQTTGAPGSTPNIVFRGGTGFDGSGSPMVVVDGVVVPSLYGINMNDVESLDVLKDAASTAIYGARASNGVILITTKKGKKGRTQVQYTLKQTYNYMRVIGDKYLDGAEYIRMNRSGIRSRYLLDKQSGDSTGNYSAMNSDIGQLTANWGWAFGSNYGHPVNGQYTTQKLTDANRKFLGMQGWNLLVDPNPFNTSLMDSILYHEISAREREKMITQFLPTTEHNINFSGANDLGAFALSLGALKDNGTIIGSSLKRLSINFNGALNVGKNLKVTLNTSAYNDNILYPYNEPGVAATGGDNVNSTGNLLQRFLGVAPTVRYYNDTSGAILPGPNDATLGNPEYWSKLYVNNLNEQRYTGSLNLEYTLLPYLKFLASGSGFMRYSNENKFTKSYQAGNGGAMNTSRHASYSNFRDLQYTYNGFLEFDKAFNDHNIKVLAGGEFTDYKRYTFIGYGMDAPTDAIPWVIASLPPAIIAGNLVHMPNVANIAASDFPYWERISSAIGRATYSFRDKYFATAILRYDGSSRLSSKNFYGAFPGFSFGWNLHSESFYKNSKLYNYINVVKPRISYGVNGNLQNFGNNYYPTAQVYANAGVYNGMGGVYAPKYINPDLRWERTNSTNYGIDLGFFKNRVTVMADYFVRNVFDKLANLNISAQTGFTSYQTNISQLQNRGFELTANAKIIVPNNIGGLSLDAGLSFYTVKSYAIKLPYNGLPGNRQNTIQVYDPNNLGQFMYVGGLIEGQRIGLYDEIWAPKWDGIYRTQAELSADAKVYNDFLSGINKRVKQLGDAKWHQVYKNDTINSYQYVFVGRKTPKASGNFFLNAGYKGFRLYTVFDYAYGFMILNNEKLRGLSQVQGSQNGTKDILDTWTPDNPNASLPRFYWANQGRNYATDASGNNPPANMWEKGDYIMMRELTVSYDFNYDFLSRVLREKIKGISLFVTGSNLAYFTKYSGSFPEIGGFDNGRYPLPRRLTLGAQITF